MAVRAIGAHLQFCSSFHVSCICNVWKLELARLTYLKYQLHHSLRFFSRVVTGEDRWLCTLLLQRGYRVEYNAASDSFTQAPEDFKEFFNQRRRWIPSTMANIVDLIGSWRKTTAVNENISFLYIAYQGLLLLGSVIGPGTIFLVMTGALQLAIANFAYLTFFESFLINLVPILIFTILCFCAKGDTQVLYPLDL